MQEGELRGAGEFGQLLAVEPARAEQVQEAGGAVLEVGEFGAEVRSGVDAGVVERAGDPGGLGGGREAGYRLGGEQQGAGAVRGGGQGGGRRDGGTARAAGPVTRTVRTGLRSPGRTRRAS